MKRKLVFLTQLFDPEYSIKGLDLMRTFQEKGYDVEVITTFPSYPKGIVFDGYKRKLKYVEYIDGIKVTRLWSFVTQKRSKLMRLTNYLSFFITSTSYLFFNRRSIDVLYGYHPQITTSITGAILKRVRKTPFITDIQDLWPESLVAEGMNPSLRIVSIIKAVVNRGLREASAIVVLSDGFKAHLEREGIDGNKIYVVHNWCPEEDRYLSSESPLPIDNHQSTRPLRFYYTGNHGPLQSLPPVIKAFAKFSREQLTLTMIGQGSERNSLIHLAQTLKADNIDFVDFLTPEELALKLKQADVLVCCLKNDELFDITIPSKTQAYLASGKAILIATGHEASRLVSEAQAGFSAFPEDVDSIVNTIRQFVSCSDRQIMQMGRNGQAYYKENLSSQHGKTKLLQVLEDVIDTHS